MIPFLDLKSQYQQIKSEIDAAVLGVLDSGAYVMGPQVEAFERRFAAWCGAPHCLAVNSGTSALHLALLAAGVGPGDEVVTVSMTFVATAAAIRYCGARPVFVDVDPVTWTMDPAHIAKAITPRTKAILPVHLHGLMADMDPIMEIARRHSLVVIEDAAQAHGAEYKGRRAGTIGDLGCFSFYPGKNLGAYGEGGAVTTARPDLAHKIALLRDWGQEQKYHHVLAGYNYRMDAIQGAILNVKMDHIDAWTRARRAIAGMYDKLLAPLGRPAPPEDRRHVYHVYAVRLAQRDAMLQAFRDEGVGAGVHYPVPVHLQEAYRDPDFPAGSLPRTERLAAEFLSLPVYPELQPEQLLGVARLLKKLTLAAAE
ncbi:dTDP-4-amino-4,6-dideoxygalactose transaminase [Rhodoblastus acidophilus]|uniref:dTDP-4-amino-4,6-dideoxygalactose transaminase n=1 Tax=Rhodoblastus acidophilus TaxID=1074 RepID=A0A212QN69_RHOAC|nr:DegT/DnrJ/EryC1/StrS family aminotransferase [Rhodoblastus acidophilus]PPQ38926.1 DegT/DnrJ/EryC1/StrS family aminotransferase [Rhodoblastus acidophilus]RAI17583.1 DegT/DnrJ/EryC1/StrS family aminotransferase [Rhodoblastus acidophilus]SNB60822.1 dTDP-4-amino-4,6-dideoxygalactose transaminase [Rhodoblastus acidophilus]